MEHADLLDLTDKSSSEWNLSEEEEEEDTEADSEEMADTDTSRDPHCPVGNGYCLETSLFIGPREKGFSGVLEKNDL